MTGYDSKLKKPGKDLNFTLRNTIRFGQGNIHQARAQTEMSDNSQEIARTSYNSG